MELVERYKISWSPRLCFGGGGHFEDDLSILKKINSINAIVTLHLDIGCRVKVPTLSSTPGWNMKKLIIHDRITAKWNALVTSLPNTED